MEIYSNTKTNLDIAKKICHHFDLKTRLDLVYNRDEVENLVFQIQHNPNTCPFIVMIYKIRNIQHCFSLSGKDMMREIKINQVIV